MRFLRASDSSCFLDLFFAHSVLLTNFRGRFPYFYVFNAVFFKVKKTTAFKKIFDAYLQRVGKAPGSLRFMFDGARVQDNQTPAELGMEDEDTIDAAAEQTGGQ